MRVIVYDGKTHSVDSKEIAFATAGRKAFIDAVLKARPIVLEPIVKVEITAPEHSMGDITGDLSAKRGQVSGTQTRAGRRDRRSAAQVPLSELTSYQARLNGMTGGQGRYTLELSHYEAGAAVGAGSADRASTRPRTRTDDAPAGRRRATCRRPSAASRRSRRPGRRGRGLVRLARRSRSISS